MDDLNVDKLGQSSAVEAVDETFMVRSVLRKGFLCVLTLDTRGDIGICVTRG